MQRRHACLPTALEEASRSAGGGAARASGGAFARPLTMSRRGPASQVTSGARRLPACTRPGALGESHAILKLRLSSPRPLPTPSRDVQHQRLHQWHQLIWRLLRVRAGGDGASPKGGCGSSTSLCPHEACAGEGRVLHAPHCGRQRLGVSHGTGPRRCALASEALKPPTNCSDTLRKPRRLTPAPAVPRTPTAQEPDSEGKWPETAVSREAPKVGCAAHVSWARQFVCPDSACPSLSVAGPVGGAGPRV